LAGLELDDIEPTPLGIDRYARRGDEFHRGSRSIGQGTEEGPVQIEDLNVAKVAVGHEDLIPAAGNAFGARNEVNPLGIEGQKELSLKLQIIGAMLDSTGLCLFSRPPVIANPQLMVDMINGLYDWGWTPEDLDRANRDVLRMENEFNQKAGITAKDHRIPEYMTKEPLPPHDAVFDIPDKHLDEIYDDL